MFAGAEEMAQPVRALATFTEALNLVLSTRHSGSQLSVTPIPEDLTPSSGL